MGGQSGSRPEQEFIKSRASQSLIKAAISASRETRSP